MLDRDEMELPFDDPVLFRDIEGSEELLRRALGVPQGVPAAMEQFLAGVSDACGSRKIDHVLLMNRRRLGPAPEPLLARAAIGRTPKSFQVH